MEQATQYIVTRPSEYSVAPQYRPSVTESHLSLYRMEVDPLAFDKDRASFSWRSPGLGVLQKSTVEIAFTVRVQSRLALGMLAQMGPQIQIVDVQNANAAFGQDPAATCMTGPAPKIAFGSGDAMQKAITSMQVIVNGAALSQVRNRDYMRSLQSCWFDKQVFQKRFNEAGGTPNKYDSVAVQSELLADVAVGAVILPYAAGVRAATAKCAGFTGDSGLKDRFKNVMSCQNAIPASVNQAAEEFRDVRIRWKLNGTGLFSPLAQSDRISHSCPYKASARALPNINVCSVSLLFDGLYKALFRNLSTVAGNHVVAANTRVAQGDNSIVITMPEPKAKLYVEYLRLPGWRAQVDRAQLQTFRIAVHDPTTDNTEQGGVVSAVCLDGANSIPVLAPIGFDRHNGLSSQFAEAGYREVTWSGITAAQIPEYLFCVCEKNLDLTSHGSLQAQAWAAPRFANVANIQTIARAQFTNPNTNSNRLNSQKRNQYMARNTDGNLAITRFSLEIMSVQGSYIYSSEAWPYLKSQSDLYRDVAKYCVPDYDDQDTWLRHNCIVLLGIQEYAKGISTSGTAFPCTFSVKARFENRRSYIEGYACAGLDGVGLGACEDAIGGRPVLGFIYPQQRLEITASSALLTSQNISHASATEILARKY